MAHPLDWGISFEETWDSKKEDNLEEHLKKLMQELGNAINESLSDSERIAEAIGEIKQSGYDVFLVLEATIGFNKRDDSDLDDDSEQPPEIITEPPRSFEATGRIKLTTQDHKFLRALKIAVDEEAR
ncbi:MAG: hypothetical protein ABIZ80_14115 [Bryobacteraceae bacterium]